jgi:hypothetical protein
LVRNGDALLHRTHRHEPPVMGCGLGQLEIVADTGDLLVGGTPLMSSSSHTRSNVVYLRGALCRCGGVERRKKAGGMFKLARLDALM